MRVGRGVGTEGESELRHRGAKLVEHEAGLHACPSFLRIDLEHAVQMFGEVDDDGDVAALTGERRAAAARENRRAEPAGDLDRRDDVFLGFRNDDADGNLTIVRSVGRIQCARAVVETDLTGYRGSQRPFEPARVAVPFAPVGTRARRLPSLARLRGHRFQTGDEIDHAVTPRPAWRRRV